VPGIARGAAIFEKVDNVDIRMTSRACCENLTGPTVSDSQTQVVPPDQPGIFQTFVEIFGSPFPPHTVPERPFSNVIATPGGFLAAGASGIVFNQFNFLEAEATFVTIIENVGDAGGVLRVTYSVPGLETSLVAGDGVFGPSATVHATSSFVHILNDGFALPVEVLFNWEMDLVKSGLTAFTESFSDDLVRDLGLPLFFATGDAFGFKTAPRHSQLRLDSLPAESAKELLAALLGPDPGLGPLTQMLVKRGNPFFLEETVRTLVETGALAGERGAYRLTRPVESLQVPATVQTILAARIDRLPPEEKQLLQAASVIGKHVPYVFLAAIAEQPEEALRRGLAHLQEAEFLYETQLFPDLEHSFKHALTHDVTYAGLLGERRRDLHAAVAAAIERLHADRLVEYVERLAHHARQGEVWDKAVRYLRQAGAKVFLRSANREAALYFEQALEGLRRLPEHPDAIAESLDLRFDLRNALLLLGERGRMGALLDEAEALAEAAGDQCRLGRALNYRVVHF